MCVGGKGWGHFITQVKYSLVVPRREGTSFIFVVVLLCHALRFLIHARFTGRKPQTVFALRA